MNKDRELMQQALEALEQVAKYFNVDSTEAKTIIALRKRLVQPDPSAYWHNEFLKHNTTSEQPAQQQEPVAWATRMGEYAHIHWGAKRPEYPVRYEVPLYTSPPAQQQSAERVEPVQTTPNFEQLKQILDNLNRCHHRESKQEFLRTWIRDWTEHKLAKYTSPQPSKPWAWLTEQEREKLRWQALEEDAGYTQLIKATEAKLREKNA